jgi:hypothetical protein
MRDAILAWLVTALLCGLLLPAVTGGADDQASVVTVTFVQPATAADRAETAASQR